MKDPPVEDRDELFSISPGEEPKWISVDEQTFRIVKARPQCGALPKAGQAVRLAQEGIFLERESFKARN